MVIDWLGRYRVVPVVVLNHMQQAQKLADALVEGGLPVMEITLRTPAGLQGIAAVAGRTDVLVGAGTVCNLQQAQRAVEAGARFLVSPGLDVATVEYCVRVEVPIFPGCCTPSEVMNAINLGVETVKFFPASAYGGTTTLQALAGPFPQVRFIPTGGITPDSLSDYLRLPSVLAVGGSWMVAPPLLQAEDYPKITHLCQQATHHFQPIP